MAVNQRFPRSSEDEGVALVDGAKDDKLQKERFQNDIRRRRAGLIFVLLAIPLLVKFRSGVDVASEAGLKGSIAKKKEDYELYPFLVSSNDIEASGAAALLKPTMTDFPVISRLEDCKVAYKPSNSPRTTESEWRRMFWIPSFPGSGAANPARKGDLVKEIIEGLFSGEEGNVAGSYLNPVKEHHMSIKKRLKRCRGVSETVGCESSHPLTPTPPEGRDKDFRPDTIVPIRNPAAAIPTFYATKHIAYHDGTKQAREEEWRNMRDQYALGTFDQWMSIVKFWRGTAEESSYYFTSVYVPFEDIMSTDSKKGTAAIKALSDSISGRNTENAKDGDFFETSSLEEDYECLWYRSAKAEWDRQRPIFGEYIPAYTQTQRDKMVGDLKAYADEVEKDPFKGESDTALVSLLRRYAKQIEAYVRVEEAQDPKR